MHHCIAESLKFNPTGSGQEVFQWMAKEHLCILVYLVSVLHSVQAGSMDKAQKYTEKALAQIQGLKSEYSLEWKLRHIYDIFRLPWRCYLKGLCHGRG